MRLLDATGALYLDTQESRGLVPADHPAVVGAMRAAAMTEADVVLLIGRKLDYQVGYGSPAVFPHARFIRIADNAGELIDNRRGQPEIAGDARARARRDGGGGRQPRAGVDKAWADGLRQRHRERMAKAARQAGTRDRRRRQDPSARDLRRHRRASPIPTTSRSPTAATS